MKKVVLTAMVLALCVGGRAFAAGENMKIGTVDFQRALNEVEQGKKAKAALKTDFDAKQKKLQVLQDSLKRLQEEAQKQGSVMSQEAMAAKQKEFGDKVLELQKNTAAYREELVQKEAKTTAAILRNLKTLTSEVGQKDGYSLIVETSQDAVLYAQSKDDLTQKLISMYNSRFTGPLETEK